MTWIKSNPLAVVCIVIIVLSLVSFYYPTHVKSSAFRAEMAARAADLEKVRSLGATSVVVPPPRPDMPPSNLQIVVNQAAINRLGQVYNEMASEYEGIYTEAQRRNLVIQTPTGQVVARQPFMNGLFPAPAPGDLNTQFQSRVEFLKALNGLYRSLGAGEPPTPTDVSNAVNTEATSYRRSLLLPQSSPLTPAQNQELLKRQAEKIEEMYREAAASYRIYAAPLIIDERSKMMYSPGVFHVGAWAQPGGKPELADIWEGQMSLWIQQDLVTSINLANNPVTNPDANLIQLPVKRIISMVVKEGYIGVPATGFGWSGPFTAETVATRNAEIKTQQSQKIPSNYTVSPTGRASNPLYDVRHAVLTVIVDSQQLPTLLNAIGQVNFQTVIGLNVTDVDEYAALREGFYYGKCDAVQVELTIESLWLREWTAGHLSQEAAAEKNSQFWMGWMPDDVRYHLGLPPRRWQGYEPLAIRKAREAAANPMLRPGGAFPNTFR